MPVVQEGKATRYHSPMIYISVVAQTHPQLQSLHPIRVLVQGARLTPQTLPVIVADLKARLVQIEATLSQGSL